MKTNKLIWAISLIAIFLAGCTGEGDVKIKVVKKVVVESNFFSADKTGYQEVPNLDILIDGKVKGKTQGGFSTFKVSEGKHKIQIRQHFDKAKYTKIYSKDITIADKSVVEAIIKINEEKSTIEFDKARKDGIAKIFNKYKLQGTWVCDEKDVYKILAISKNGEWRDTNKYGKSRLYKPTKDIKFEPDTYIEDSGDGLVFVYYYMKTAIKYPHIKDGCFNWIGKRDGKTFKFCKKYD